MYVHSNINTNPDIVNLNAIVWANINRRPAFLTFPVIVTTYTVNQYS